VARVDVSHAEVTCPGERSCRGAGAAGDVEAVELADDGSSPGYLGRRDVRDLRARQRRAEAAVEAPKLRADLVSCGGGAWRASCRRPGCAPADGPRCCERCRRTCLCLTRQRCWLLSSFSSSWLAFLAAPPPPRSHVCVPSSSPCSRSVRGLIMDRRYPWLVKLFIYSKLPVCCYS